jgi:hypothetical protein
MAMITIKAPKAAAIPDAADRHPRVTATAKTIVRASTISTAHAANAAATNRNECKLAVLTCAIELGT